MLPEWCRAKVCDRGKYLGVMPGQGKDNSCWEAPAAKYERRIEQWAPLPVGMLRGCQNYINFVFSVLGFHWQLEGIPAHVLELENKALRKFNAGPGNWALNEDLLVLNCHYGFPAAYPSARTMALAAKLRVSEFEVPEAQARAASLWETWLESESRPFPLDWYKSSRLCVLDAAVKHAQKLGVTRGTAREALMSGTRRKVADVNGYVKRNFQ